MATLREQLLDWYNKIPYDPEMDTVNLNLELADILLQSEELRDMFAYANNWSPKEFEKVALTLKDYGFASWEVIKVFETYSPIVWEERKKDLEPKINDIMCSLVTHEIDVFQIDYDIYPYKVSQNGIEVIDKTSDLEEYNTISETPIIISATGTNLDDDSFMYQCTYKNIIGVRNTKWVAPSQLLTSDLKELVDMGLHLNDSDFKHMKAYFKKMVKHAAKMPREFTAKKTGWKKENSVFIIGDYSYSANGKKPIIPIDDTLSAVYEQKGDVDHWVKTMVPMLEYDLTRIKCYAVVSAMILKLIDSPAFVIHNYYESSGSKTLTMGIAASLIGDPGALCRDSSISEVGLEKAASMNTDTALFFDETTKTPEFGKMVYTLVNGRGKTSTSIPN